MANGANLTAILNAATSMFGNLFGALGPSFTSHASASSAVEGFLTQATAQLNDPDAIKSAADGILRTPGVSIDIAMLARQMQLQANNPNAILGIAARISGVLASQNSSIFSHITSYIAPTSVSPGTITLG